MNSDLRIYKKNNYKGNTSDLEEFSGLIIADFNEKCPKTIDEAIERIGKLTGIKRSATRATVFLKKLFTHKKARSIPAKANKKDREKFLTETLEPLLVRAKKGHVKVYGASLGYSWCIQREEVKSAYGRQRFNVMGLLDRITHETITVTHDTYSTSAEIVELLKRTREMNKGKTVYSILDNAKYQKYKLVKAAARKYQY